jgi:hypothetical protein
VTIHQDIKQYLLDHSVEVAGPLDTPCLVWTRGCDGDGYGIVHFKSRPQRVHRFAYEAFIGPIPEGRLICHKCDNPPCWRIEHIYCGTCATNNQDTVRRGRHRTGLGGAKLTEGKVLEIRLMAHEGKSRLCIAARFDISLNTVSDIIRGRTWPDVGGPRTFKRPGLKPRSKDVRRGEFSKSSQHVPCPDADELVNEMIEVHA